MSNLFHHIEGAVLILRQGGTFKQVSVFQRKGHLYAEKGAGSYIRLMQDGKTSVPKVFYEDLYLGGGKLATTDLPHGYLGVK